MSEHYAGAERMKQKRETQGTRPQEAREYAGGLDAVRHLPGAQQAGI